MLRPLALIAAACLAATLVTVAPTTAAAPAEAASKYVSAKTLLKRLPVKAESHSHKYKRAQFAYPLDADHDGCNTRKEVLIQEHIGKIRISSSCAVYSKWKSFFDNRTTTKAGSLEVDHLVPIAEAWYSGAYKWSSQKKKAFGNDVGYKWSLNAVTTKANRSKGAGDPADWMPAKNKCTYAEAWVGVKSRWGLSVDRREKAKLTSLLRHCGSSKVLKPGKPNLAALSGVESVVKKPANCPTGYVQVYVNGGLSPQTDVDGNVTGYTAITAGFVRNYTSQGVSIPFTLGAWGENVAGDLLVPVASTWKDGAPGVLASGATASYDGLNENVSASVPDPAGIVFHPDTDHWVAEWSPIAPGCGAVPIKDVSEY